MKIGIANDHAGYDYKVKLISFLTSKGHICSDFGAESDKPCDYPDYAHPLSCAVEKGEIEFGISICGTGNGVSMTANKHAGIRSAICWAPDIAMLVRKHNDANVCAIPARFMDFETVCRVVEIFLTTSFEGGRHVKRIMKIPINKDNCCK